LANFILFTEYPYYKTGKKTEACKDWRKAQSLGIQSAGTYVRRYCR